MWLLAQVEGVGLGSIAAAAKHETIDVQQLVTWKENSLVPFSFLAKVTKFLLFRTIGAHDAAIRVQTCVQDLGHSLLTVKLACLQGPHLFLLRHCTIMIVETLDVAPSGSAKPIGRTPYRGSGHRGPD